MAEWKDGKQVIYVPDHAFEYGVGNFLHPDCEIGFMYGNFGRGIYAKAVFVRYFEKFSWPITEQQELPDLRTKANGELTELTNLFYVDTLPQDYIDEWVDTLNHGQEGGL